MTTPASDIYVNYGLHIDGWRDWDDAQRLGFVCAGGGRRYSDPLRSIMPHERLWVYIPSRGYAGVGYAVGPVQTAEDFLVNTVMGDDRPIRDVLGPYANDREHPHDADLCEYFLRVRWLQTVPLELAVGNSAEFFSNSPVVCRPAGEKWLRTLEMLRRAFPDYDKG